MSDTKRLVSEKLLTTSWEGWNRPELGFFGAILGLVVATAAQDVTLPAAKSTGETVGLVVASTCIFVFGLVFCAALVDHRLERPREPNKLVRKLVVPGRSAWNHPFLFVAGAFFGVLVGVVIWVLAVSHAAVPLIDDRATALFTQLIVLYASLSLFARLDGWL